MDKLTAKEALKIVMDRAQWMRSEGESDMRSIVWLCAGLMNDIDQGKTRDEIMSKLQDDEDE